MARRAVAGGFVLVGVVMFVLALTILGLSLYSLSDYEATFLEQSHDTNAALYRAQGGMDMVKAIVATYPFSLADAPNAVGYNGITAARAFQKLANGNLDSTGTVNWDSMITVTVTAHRGAISRTLRATYRPTRQRSLYKRLFTTSGTTCYFEPSPLIHLTANGGIYVDTDQPQYSLQSLDVNSRVWQNTADSTWRNWVALPNPHPQLLVGGVPQPDVPGYLLVHPATTTPTVPAWTPGHPFEVRLDAPPAGNYVIYNDNTPFKTANFSFSTETDLTQTAEIYVKGTAIWELPKGLFSYQRLTVHSAGGPNPTLVLVGSPYASRNPPYNSDPGLAMSMIGGLVNADNINIIIVSDGRVNIEQIQNFSNGCQADRLSIYTRSLSLGGPASGGVSSRLDYDTSMDAIIDNLEQTWDILPHGLNSPPTATFALIKGSWQDLTP